MIGCRVPNVVLRLHARPPGRIYTVTPLKIYASRSRISNLPTEEVTVILMWSALGIRLRFEDLQVTLTRPKTMSNIRSFSVTIVSLSSGSSCQDSVLGRRGYWTSKNHITGVSSQDARQLTTKSLPSVTVSPSPGDVIRTALVHRPDHDTRARSY